MSTLMSLFMSMVWLIRFAVVWRFISWKTLSSQGLLW